MSRPVGAWKVLPARVRRRRARAASSWSSDIISSWGEGRPLTNLAGSKASGVGWSSVIFRGWTRGVGPLRVHAVKEISRVDELDVNHGSCGVMVI